LRRFSSSCLPYNQCPFRPTQLVIYIRELTNQVFHDSAVSATLEWITLPDAAVQCWGGFICFGEQLTFGSHYSRIHSGLLSVYSILCGSLWRN